MKKIISIILCFAFALAFCACGNTGDEVIVVSDGVKIDIDYSSESMGFSLNMISISEKTEVEFVRFEGTGLENIRDVEFKKRTFEAADQVKKDGNYFHAYHFKVNTILKDTSSKDGNYSVNINSVVLKVDGKERTVDFEFPIKYYHNKNYNDRSTYMYGPLTISGASLEMGQEFSFSVTNAQEDIYIKNFYFSDFLDAKNAKLCAEVETTSSDANGGSVNGVMTEELGKIDGTTLYKVEAGKKSVIYCVPALKNMENISKYDFITCMATLEYCIEGDDTVYKAKFPINSQGIYSVEAAEAFITYVMGN
ncbi:MAG: hypothetical protein IJX27_01420 [Clostridia bacterium]|nr:hypothetical protein [Clostridia bacterium]